MDDNNFQNFLQLCHYAGGRFDLVQAGGGNAGTKIANDAMLVSQGIGCVLSETTEKLGYVSVDPHKIADVLADQRLCPIASPESSLKEKTAIANSAVKEANETPEIKPTAEVFLHALLPFKHTLHLHPVVINAILIRSDAKDIVADLFPEAGFVEYGAPGLEVSAMFGKYMQQLAKAGQEVPNLYFMKSHGIMVGHDELSGLIDIIERMLDSAEAYFGMTNTAYRDATKIAALLQQVSGKSCIAHLSGDHVINRMYREDKEAFFFTPCYPDQYVYNGVTPLELNQLDAGEIAAYQAENNGLFPSVVVYHGNIYFVSANLKIAHELEEVFKSHLLIISMNKGSRDKIDTLDSVLHDILFSANPLNRYS